MNARGNSLELNKEIFNGLAVNQCHQIRQMVLGFGKVLHLNCLNYSDLDSISTV